MKRNFFMMETECEALFFRNKPFWHLCTPGESMEIIYTDEIEFNFGINLLAICLAEFPDLTAYTFELMNNHIHIILSGPEEDCLGMFNLYKVKLHQFIQRKKRIVDLSGFMPEVLPIEDLRAFRNETVYVNRNGYVVNPSTTPFSYPWGGGRWFFMDWDRYISKRSYSELTFRQKREISHGRVIELPQSYSVWNGIIIPPSFCDIIAAQMMFRDAHQYFNLLSKNYEAYSQIAGKLGDRIFITDEEMYSAVLQICHKKYGVSNPAALTPRQRHEVALTMHKEYNASNHQIRSILKLAPSIVNEMFPLG